MADIIMLNDEDLVPWYFLDQGEETGKGQKLKGYLGFDSIDEEAGPFRVIASAVQYLADVLKISPGEKAKLREQVLFYGGVQIYEPHEVPDTDIRGLKFIVNGGIWTTTDPDQRGHQGLHNLILGEDPVGSEERIKSVIRGYEVETRREKKRKSGVPPFPVSGVCFSGV